ncbi:MAG: aminotransferase class I/II-fold pyridoxal phosphate-dependent enzyme [Pleurocapsa minor GSE-CHR-MK-17-07R]|nr:aminotransferase class I/II-fold pyridoxal phosphate-dependent enzyme [Pleurocapsa minor GSE-CHR-MK 17-07R]
MSAQPVVTSSLDTPEYAHPLANRVAVNDYPAHMQDIPPSRMFLIRDALKAYKDREGAGAVTFDASQGDGGASLPGTPTHILEAALKLQIDHGTAYDQPWGTARFRKAAAESYWKFDSSTGWSGENIVFVQGGRDGLQKAYGAMIALGHKRVGDALVVSRVPWISYNWGPYAVGLNVLLAPGRPEEGWRYTPDSIRATAEFAQREGRGVAGLVITSPDNPTGRTIPLEEQILLARTAIEAGYPFVLFDWIYHWVTDHGPNDINVILNAFSPAEREKLIFLDGLTKSLGGSNVRSAHLVAGKAVVKHITSQASHSVIPAFFSQAVAIAAYEMGFGEAAKDIIQACSASRKVLRTALEESGVGHIIGDGYYAFIDCTQHIESGSAKYDYLKDSEGLLKYLGENYGLAVVPGVYFSPAGANWIRFSYALPPDVTAGAVERLFAGLNALK